LEKLGRLPRYRSDPKYFIQGLPLWFHKEYQGFDSEYDINDLLRWTPHRDRKVVTIDEKTNQLRYFGDNELHKSDQYWYDFMDYDLIKINETFDGNRSDVSVLFRGNRGSVMLTHPDKHNREIAPTYLAARQRDWRLEVCMDEIFL